MAKDYFQDIIPPSNSNSGQNIGQNRSGAGEPASDGGTSVPIRTSTSVGSHTDDIGDDSDSFSSEQPASVRTDTQPAGRSIRDIPAPRPRQRPIPDMRDTREAPAVGMGMPKKTRSSKIWIWVAAGVSIIVLAVLLFVALRPTLVTIVPRSHAISFDQASQFIAYPAATAATGTLAYSLQVADIEDSQVVPSQGTVHAEEKASGSITVYNDYQTSPMKLVKTTRFQTPDGLIFRVPADIVIPGKKGSTPGQVTVTVIADKAGEAYNVAATRFTVPGLKNSPSYTHVYAQSTAAITGGFVGDKPGVAPGALESAIAEVRGRLEAKAREGVASTESTVMFSELTQITYQDLPSTTEAGGGVRIHERAHVVTPVFAAEAFAKYVAQTISADAGDSSVRIVPGNGYMASLSNASSTLGTDAIQFTLAGAAQLIWNVDSAALTQALAGRDQSAFESIVATFPGIQEAHARIEPFWKSTFPADSGAIKIQLEPVKA